MSRLRNALPAAALAAALALGPASAPGQEAVAQAPEKISLRFGPADGTRLTYSLSSVVNVDGKNLMGANLGLNADSRGEIRLLSRASTADTVRADLTSPGIDVNIRLPEKTTSQKLGIPRSSAAAIPSTSPFPRSCATISRPSPPSPWPRATAGSRTGA
jgi:hypothetical protein